MLAEAASSTPLGLDHLTDRAQHVCQTFLLFHTGQSLSIVAPDPDPLTAAETPAYPHPVFCHLRSGHRGDVGHVCNLYSLILESASTSGTVVVGHRHIHWRLGDLICRGRLAVAERPYARLSAGTFGSVGSPTLGERGCLALSRSLGLGEFLTQLFDRRRKTRNLILLSADQGDQLPVFTGSGESLSDAHSRSIRTCPCTIAIRTQPKPLINYLRVCPICNDPRTISQSIALSLTHEVAGHRSCASENVQLGQCSTRFVLGLLSAYAKTRLPSRKTSQALSSVQNLHFLHQSLE